MTTVGSLAYSIVANTQQFTSGVVASKSELRDLKAAFLATQTPAQTFSAAIEHLEGLAEKFPEKAGVLHQAIHQIQHEMEHASPQAQFLHEAMHHLGIVVDPVSAAFKVAEMGIESFHKAVEGTVEVVHAVAEKIESLNKLGLTAGRLGVDPGELIGLAGAAKELTGIDFEGFTSMLTKFETNLGQAAVEAKGPAYDAFTRLGLKVEELSTMPADEALKKTVHALSEVDNVFERSFLAKEIGGKVGPQFAQFLAAGDEKITEITEHVKDLEQVKFLDPDGIHEAAVAMEDFEHRLSGIMNLAASAFAPLFKQALGDIDELFGKAAGSGEGLKEVVHGLALATAGFMDELEKAAQLGGAYVAGGLPGVAGALAHGVTSGRHLDRMIEAQEQAEKDRTRDRAEAAEKVAAAMENSRLHASGLIEAGNVDLLHRPQVKNEDGSISTVRSMSTNIDGLEVLIPTVSKKLNRILTDSEAVEEYIRTGEHLGKFKTPEDADKYAELLHKQQEAYYTGSPMQAEIAAKADAAAQKREAIAARKEITSWFDLQLQDVEMEIAREKEAAKAKIEAEKERLAIVNRVLEAESKAYADHEKQAESIAKSQMTGPEKMREELEKLQELEKGGFFDLHPGAYDRALQDLKFKAQDASGLGDTSRGTTAAVTIGSVEGLRAINSGQSNGEKQLAEQKKLVKSQADATALLRDINKAIQGNAMTVLGN